jgi:hypothetical protein
MEDQKQDDQMVNVRVPDAGPVIGYVSVRGLQALVKGTPCTLAARQAGINVVPIVGKRIADQVVANHFAAAMKLGEAVVAIRKACEEVAPGEAMDAITRIRELAKLGA